MGIWTIVIFELIQWARNRVNLIILFVLPLLVIMTLGFALQDDFKADEHAISKVKVAIWYEDSDPVMDELADYLNQPSVKELILPIDVRSKSEIMQYIKSGKAHFGLIIPNHISSDRENGKQTNLELIPGYGLSKNITAQTVFGTFSERLNIRQEFETFSDNGFAMPGAQNTYIEIEKPANFTSFHYYSSHMLTLFLLYSGMMGAVNLLQERKNHTFLRLFSAPIPSRNIIIGKLLAVVFISFIQAGIIIFTATAVFHVEWGISYFSIMVAVLLMIAASLGISLLIASFVNELNELVTIATVVFILLTFVAGGFYPGSEGFAEGISIFTPNYWTSSILLTSVDTNPPTQFLPLVIISTSLLICGYFFFLKRKMVPEEARHE